MKLIDTAYLTPAEELAFNASVQRLTSCDLYDVSDDIKEVFEVVARGRALELEEFGRELWDQEELADEMADERDDFAEQLEEMKKERDELQEEVDDLNNTVEELREVIVNEL